VISNGEIDLKLDSALPPDSPCFNKPTSQSQVTDSTTRLTLEVSGMDCADCAMKVTRAVERLANVDLLDFNYFTGHATVTHDPEITTARSITNFVARATGFAVNPLIQDDTNDPTTHNSLPLKFSKPIPEDVLSRFDVRSKGEAGGYMEVSFMAKGAAARSSREVMAELAAYGPTLVDADLIQKARDRVTHDFKSVGLRTSAIIILAIPVLILAWAPLPRNPIAYGAASVALTTLIQGLAMPIVMSSVRSILFLHQADMAVLITVSTLTAYIFSLVAFGLEVAGTPFAEPFFETTALLIPLIYLGRFIQASCRKSAKSTVAALQQLQSKEVVLVVGDGSSAVEQPLDIRLLHYGDIIRIRPNTRLPTDGTVVAGTGQVNEASATGESLPVTKKFGDSAIAATLNVNGTFDLQVDSLAHENSLSRVCALVQQAQNSRSPYQDRADRFAAAILPIASTLALVAFIAWMLVNRFAKRLSPVDSFVSALTYALSILIVSCPCAIGLAIPLVMSSAMRIGLREKVLFRSAEAIQATNSADTFIFDKTGTLSQGKFCIQHQNVVISDCERLLFGLVSSSDHPISKAIAQHLSIEQSQTSNDQLSIFDNVEVLPGLGIKTRHAGYDLLGGSPKFTDTLQHPFVKRLESLSLSIFVVTFGGRLLAAFGLADAPREDSAALVEDLKARNKRVVMLSGDNLPAARRFARLVNIPDEDVEASCTPASKADYIKDVQQQGHKVCFVGDGVNDGPALARANIGVAMGSGSDVAISASGAVFLNDNLHRSVVVAADLAVQARQHSIAALAWCFVYFILAFLLASGVLIKVKLEPQWAGLGELMSVVPVIVIGLSLHLRWIRYNPAGI